MKIISRTQRVLLPKLQDILFIAIFVAVIGLGSRMFNIDGDLGRHLTIGEHIIKTLSIPRADIFSHTMAGEVLTPHEWLAQVLFAFAFRIAGLDGVVLLCAFVIALTFTLLFGHSYKRSGLLLVSIGWTILAAAAASLHWLARPHIFTLLLVVFWVGAMEDFRRGRHNKWWVFPLIMLFWANLHGAFIAGFVIGGMYFLGELWDGWTSMTQPRMTRSRLRSWILIGATSLVASLINPAGWRLWETSFGFIRNRYLVSHTAEYLPPNFHNTSTWPFLILIGLSILLLARTRFRIPGVYALLLSGWTLMGLYSVRNVPIYALIAAPILAEISAQQILKSKLLKGYAAFEKRLSSVESSLLGYLVPVVVVVLVTFGLTSGIDLDFDRTGNRFNPQVFPVEAMIYLEDNQPEGNMFNYFTWGGYLLYQLWPEKEVFIDGQTDFYGESFTRLYERVITLDEGWQKVLNSYDVKWVIMPANSKLVQTLLSDPQWEAIYLDEVTAVLIRDQSD